jgi:hypothetical protein
MYVFFNENLDGSQVIVHVGVFATQTVWQNAFRGGIAGRMVIHGVK